MRRILLDTTRLLYRRLRGTLPTGIDRVSLAYIERYSISARAVLSLGPFSAILSEPDSQALFAALQSDSGPPLALAARVIAKSFLWRWLVPARDGDLLLNTSHTGLESPRYAALLRAHGARVVVLVHDLIPLTHPEYTRPHEHRKHRTRMRSAAHNAAAIIANSRDTLEAFRRVVSREGLTPPPSRVALLGIGLKKTGPGPRPIAAPYFLMVATLETRKNHLMLLDLWARRADLPPLVLIGQTGSRPEYAAQIIERCRSLGDRATYIARCSDAELANWMDHAQAVLLPSFAEGFGLPILEAISRGVPAIASDLPALREAVGDIPEYADPRDLVRWEKLVGSYADESSSARKAQCERMRNFSAPTWEAHFAEVDKLLDQLCAGTA